MTTVTIMRISMVNHQVGYDRAFPSSLPSRSSRHPIVPYFTLKHVCTESHPAYSYGVSRFDDRDDYDDILDSTMIVTMTNGGIKVNRRSGPSLC